MITEKVFYFSRKYSLKMPLSNLRTFALSLPETSGESPFEKTASKVAKKLSQIIKSSFDAKTDL